MAEEMRIDGAVGDGEAQPGNEKVFEVFPDLSGVGFFVFHRQIQSGNFGKVVDGPDKAGIFNRQLKIHRQKKKQRFNAESTESGEHRSQRKKQISRCARDDNFALRRRTGGTTAPGHGG